MTDQTTVHLDLDAQARPDEDARKEPFTANIGGDLIRFQDPQDVDWVALSEMEDSVTFIRAITVEDDLPKMMKKRFPQWKFQKLADAYNDYYDLGSQGEGVASPGI